MKLPVEIPEATLRRLERVQERNAQTSLAIARVIGFGLCAVAVGLTLVALRLGQLERSAR